MFHRSWSHIKLYQTLVSYGVHIFEHMCFVINTVVKLELLEEGLVFIGAVDNTVCGQQDIQRIVFAFLQDVVADIAAFFLWTPIYSVIQCGAPQFNLTYPVVFDLTCPIRQSRSNWRSRRKSQVPKVDGGTTIRWMPVIPLCTRYARKAIVWIVLPRPFALNNKCNRTFLSLNTLTKPDAYHFVS